MAAYIVRRLGFLVVVLLGVTILTFFLARVVPFLLDPVAAR